MNTSGVFDTGPQDSVTSNSAETPTASYKILKFHACKMPQSYRAMVFSEFLRSLRFGNEYFRLVDAEPYFHVYHAYFSVLLARPDAILQIAVLSDEHDTALGWSLTETDKLHYVYVKKDYRKLGIGRALVSEPFSRFTHVTKIGLSLWTSKAPNAKFNPFC